MTSERSKTYCALPWIHLSTRPNGHMRVCCTANASSVGATNDKVHGGEVGILKNSDGKPSNLNHSDLLSSWNNGYMKNVRLKMLNGEAPPSCQKCFNEEEAGHQSKRNWETAYWGQRIDLDQMIKDTKSDGSIEPKLYYIDLRMGTKCNLKCIMCSPHDSSMWVQDWREAYDQVENEQLKDTMQWNNKGQVDGASYAWHQDNPLFWQQLYSQIPHMKQLYFAGGEPTIIEEHFKLLEECVGRGYAHDIELRYNSNAVELPERMFDLWKKFKRVRFHYSIDSIEDMNSYIRYPSQWSQVEQAFKRLDETDDHVEVTVACAVQMLNMHYIPDLIRWKIEQGYKKINPWPLGAGMINYHFVYHPPQLNVRVFPTWFKDKIEDKYNNFNEWLLENYQHFTPCKSKDEFLGNNYGAKRLKGMVSFMKGQDWSNRMPEFIEYITIMDRIRGTSFAQTFPEMAPILNHEQTLGAH
jgi:MoaA/NifB/PqqE/SkfB family radical SAM enzyme